MLGRRGLLAGLLGGPPGPLQGPQRRLAGLLAPLDRRVRRARRWRWRGGRRFDRGVGGLGCSGVGEGEPEPGRVQIPSQPPLGQRSPGDWISRGGGLQGGRGSPRAR